MHGQGPTYDGIRPGDRMVVVGAGVFGLGLLATLVTVVPLFLGTDPMPTAVYLLTALMPVGLAVALVGMLRGNRSRRRH